MTSRVSVIITANTTALDGYLRQGYTVESITAAGATSPAWLVVLVKVG